MLNKIPLKISVPLIDTYPQGDLFGQKIHIDLPGVRILVEEVTVLGPHFIHIKQLCYRVND